MFLDTAPVIYLVEQHPQYFALTRVVFELLQQTSLIGIASPVTLAECLVRPYSLGQIELQQDFIELITDNENIEFVPIADQSIALNAAQIRAKYNIKLPDAFQIAVALSIGCEAFLTNDVTFRRITELPILLLDDFNNAK
nr:PIN domain-containing protein [Komarekiella delphini-convector]